MGLWCKDLPFVTVERSIVGKRVTLVYPYFECPQFFAVQQKHWADMPYLEHLWVNVVDDGSPTYPAANALRQPRLPFLSLYRIDRKVPWNWLAARNIGAHEARDGWLLLTDMDHVVPAETLEAVIYGVHRTDTIYGFSRVEHIGKAAQPHANSFLLTKAMYWKWGGYDEELSGNYGSNGDAYRRMWQTAPMAILTDKLVRHEFQGDSSTTQFKRKLPEDAAAVKKIVAARGKDWTPKTLSYTYHEVTLQSREVA